MEPTKCCVTSSWEGDASNSDDVESVQLHTSRKRERGKVA